MPYAIFENGRVGMSTMDAMVAIVTGGGQGIGAATVRALAARGVKPVVNYATSAQAAEELAHATGGIAVQADVADDAACRRLADAARDAFGRIDLLVNNAGRTKFANHEDLHALDAEDFLDLYRLNVVGAFQMIRACTPAMREGPASAVVNIASVAGIHGHGSSVAYAASKGAMITLTQSLARALSPTIRVNAVAPGYVGTGWFERRLGAEGLAAMNATVAASTPLALAAGPDDIAAPIVMLLDPANRAMTGEVVRVDAGAHLDLVQARRASRG